LYTIAALGLAAAATARLGAAAEPAKASEEEGARHFLSVAKVLQSPRCMNCHPAGDAPLHGDSSAPHSMNVSRKSPEAGLRCTTCHRESNQDEPHAPPGTANWHRPSAEAPMVFQGLSGSQLCAQLKDSKHNGGRTPEMLQEHMDHDALVLWAWSPGPGRTTPPMTHAAFMTHVKGWVQAGAPCPK
jgi:hypothetical protein